MTTRKSVARTLMFAAMIVAGPLISIGHAGIFFTELRGGKQIWITADAFTSRSSAQGYPDFQQDYDALSALGGAAYYFPKDTLSTPAEQLDWWVQYDIPAGSIPAGYPVPGTWYFWTRTQQPYIADSAYYNADADWLIVNGHATDLSLANPTDADWLATVQPGTVDNNDDRILQDIFIAGAIRPNWVWISETAATMRSKTLSVVNAANTVSFRIYEREASTWNGRIDMICWADDPAFVPTDEDLDAFCQDRTVFDATAVSPAYLVRPQGVVTLTITGQNVAELETVSLVQTPKMRSEYDPPIPPRNVPDLPFGYDNDDGPFWMKNTQEIRDTWTIPGYILSRPNANTIEVMFDLHNKQTGFYDVVGTRSGFCAKVDAAIDAFELRLPQGSDVIANGGFESGAIDPWVLIPEPYELTLNGDPMPGAELVNIPPATEWEGFTPYAGEYIVAAKSVNEIPGPGDYVTPNKGLLEQNVGLPFGPGDYNLTLHFYCRLWDTRPNGVKLTATVVGDEGYLTEHFESMSVELIDLPLMTIDGFDPYVPLSVDFSAYAERSIVVRFAFETDANAGWGGRNLSIAAVDNVRLLSDQSACHTPASDADGDGDVDLADFAQFLSCFNGPSRPWPAIVDQQVCACLDTDDDNDVDLADFAQFLSCFNGPTRPPACP